MHETQRIRLPDESYITQQMLINLTTFLDIMKAATAENHLHICVAGKLFFCGADAHFFRSIVSGQGLVVEEEI